MMKRVINKYQKIYLPICLGGVLMLLSLLSAVGQTWEVLNSKGGDARVKRDYPAAIKYYTLAKTKVKKGSVKYMKSLIGLTASYRHSKNKGSYKVIG